MDQPPLWLMLLGSSFFGLLTRAKAAKYNKNTTIWFWLGFVFGIWGFIAFYLTKKTTQSPSNIKLQSQAPSTINLDQCAWYYSLDNQIHGPSSADFVTKLYHEGTLNDETLLWNENLVEWTKLKQFKK